MAREILKNQYIRLGAICACALLVSFGFYHLAFQGGGPTPPPAPHRVDLPIDKVNVQDIWMNKQNSILSKLEVDQQLSDQKVKVLEEEILSARRKESEEKQEGVELRQMISSLKQELKRVSEKVEQHEKNNDSATVKSIENLDKPRVKHIRNNDKTHTSKTAASFPFSHPSGVESQELGEQKQLRPQIREVSIGKRTRRVFSVDKRIPAGVSARALLVSSVDAVCGVYSNSDPIPVKLRLLDDGHLPKGIDASIKGCVIIGSAFGNISNERVYIRLERLTKVNKEGEAVETEVAGYVSGEDGKFGLRGTVVDRSGKILKNAAASGILGGVAQALQACVARQPVDCWNTYAVGVDAAKRGVASGTSSAFDLLADYYIRRAEQVQPVLQVNAGRIVDVTFTHGFEMGDLNTKEKISEVRERSRKGQKCAQS